MTPRACAFLLAASLLGSQVWAGSAEKSLDVYWLDVEGGLSTLLVTPQNEAVLVDTGFAGSRDSGRILQAAQTAGVSNIDQLIITHFHSDHVGGAADLAKLMPIGIVRDRGIPEHDPDGRSDANFQRLVTPYREMKAGRRLVLKPGDDIPLRQSSGALATRLALRCLAVGQQFVAPPAGALTNSDCATSTNRTPDTTDNVNCVVMLLTFGPFRLYLGADLSWNLENKLVCPVDLVGPVDVYQVDHHGYDDASNPVLLRVLNPTVAVMSNSPRGGCQPGVFRTLSTLTAFQSIYQLHRNLQGPTAKNAPDEFIANLTADHDGNYIKLSIAPDGKTYTFSIPANGHSRTYQTKRAN